MVRKNKKAKPDGAGPTESSLDSAQEESTSSEELQAGASSLDDSSGLEAESGADNDAALEAGEVGSEGVDAGAVDESDVMREFSDYESLEDEYPEDDADDEVADELGASAEEGEPAEDSGIVTPKHRRLAAMRLEAKVEAVIFASQKPLKASEIHEILGEADVSEEDVQQVLDHLVEFYEDRHGGFKLHYLKRMGYQFQTSESAALIMEKMFASRPRPISRAALETLSIIAYRQPVTRAEVEFIRGVDAGSIFKTLLERSLIKCVGRKEIPGRPMIFGTTDEFLKVFNLSSIKDLPPLEAFQPSHEVVQGARERLAEGDELVDIEEYIADNTNAGMEEGDVDITADVPGAEPDDLLEQAAAEIAGGQSAAEPAQRSLQGATAANDDAGSDFEGLEGDLVGDDSGGRDADSEVVVPGGDCIPPGSGEMDS